MLLNILLGLLIVVAMAMSGVILLQRSEGGGIVSGGTGQLMTARGAGNLLTKTTQVLAAIFFVLSLMITILTGRESTSSDIVNRLKAGRADPTLLQKAMAPPPATPVAPTSAPATIPLPAPTPITLPPVK